MKTRKAFEIFPDDFDAVTFLKPHSGEYENFLFVVYEDAYGEIFGQLVKREEIITKFGLSNAEFQEILNKL